MNQKKEQAKKDSFVKRMLPALRHNTEMQNQAKANQDDRQFGLVLDSAKKFNEMLRDLENSDLVDIHKIHALNDQLTRIGDELDMTPEEMLAALALLGKYIVFHANFNDGERIIALSTLLGINAKRLIASGHSPYERRKELD